jgi:ribosomal protein S18 acetylase RimI-like enzyme
MQTGSWLIAECDRVAAGCVFYEARMDFMYLGRLAVLPHYRGRGIANALIAQVETLAYQGGLHHVRLGVRVALPALRATYERRGYRVIEYHTHQGFTEPTYVMLDKPLPVIPDLTV